MWGQLAFEYFKSDAIFVILLYFFGSNYFEYCISKGKKFQSHMGLTKSNLSYSVNFEITLSKKLLPKSLFSVAILLKDYKLF